MSMLVAELACSDDVLTPVGSAIALRFQVLSGTAQQPRLRSRKTMRSSKSIWVFEPDGRSAVVAAKALTDGSALPVPS